METIKEILMRKYTMTADGAEAIIQEAAKDLANRLENGENADDICQEWFGLEPDYLFELIEYL